MDARTPVIFVTMAKAADAAIEAMKQGAYDYLFKPLDPDQLRTVVGRGAGGRPADAARRPSSPSPSPTPMRPARSWATSPAMREVYKAIGRVAAQDVPVLITGESGTGKELVARAIYQHGRGPRRRSWRSTAPPSPRPCSRASCSATRRAPSPAPSGAASASSSSARGGTLFLDEVGDMPLAVQAKVLRLLQEQAFERVGGNETVRTDVRLIAATHRDLKALVGRGEVPAGPVLPAGGLHDPPAPAARAGRRPAAARPALPAAVQPGARPRGPGRRPRGDGAAAGLRLAGEHPRAAERPQAGAAARQRHGAAAVVPARAPGGAGRIGPIVRPAGGGPRPACPSSGVAWGPIPATSMRRLTAGRTGSCCPQVLEYTDGNQHRAARLLGIARQTLRLRLRELGLHVARSVEAAPPGKGWDDAPSSWSVVGSDAHQAIA